MSFIYDVAFLATPHDTFLKIDYHVVNLNAKLDRKN